MSRGQPAMLNRLKISVYHLARAFGLFRLSRHLTKHRLRILGYHGFAVSDETHFRPKLFISAATFERRLEFLRRNRYRVVSLDEAIADLGANRNAQDHVVITIDDGYASTLTIAAPILRRHGYPATVYITSYHMDKQTPVFDVVLPYLFWKSMRSSATVTWPTSDAAREMDISTPAARDLEIEHWVNEGHRLASESQRVDLCRELANALSVDYEAIVRSGAFRLLSPSEARELPRMNIEIGLHTHRHQFPPEDPDICARELADNREYLRKHVGATPVHFCYPSGVYAVFQSDLLRADSVISATTCDIALATAGDSVFALPRFLDGEMVDDIEFEAELSGFSDLIRGLFRRNRRSGMTAERRP